jgi:hypothetical protein
MNSAPFAESRTDGDGADGHWLSPLRYALLLGLMVFAAFPEIVLGRRTFFFRDYAVFTYPLAFYQRQCFWHGELPLWDPYLFFGIPFLAQWNTISLYPPALFYLLLPLPWSLSFFCLGHLFLAGLGMYCLVRHWTHNNLAAAIAGTSFSFSGMALNALMWHCTIAAFAWMPWVVLWVERGWMQGGRAVIAAILIASLQMLTGSPEMVLFTWIVLGCLALAQLFRTPANRWNISVRFALVIFGVSGLAAIQLLPFLECLRHSLRAKGYTLAYAMPAWGWINLLVPAFRAWQHPAGVLCQPQQDYTTSYYLGVGVLWLIMWTFWRVRNSRVSIMALLFVASLLLALGNHVPGFGWMFEHLPWLALMRFPVKFAYLATFTGTFGLGLGIAELHGQSWKRLAAEQLFLRGLGLLLLLVLVLIACWAALRPAPWENSLATLRNALGRALMLLLFWFVLRALAKTTSSRWQQGLALGLVLVVWLDGITHCPRQNPTVDPSVYRPGLLNNQGDLTNPPRLGQGRVYLRQQDANRLVTMELAEATSIVVSYRLAHYLNCPLLDEVPSCFGLYPLYLADSGAVMMAMQGAPDQDIPHLSDFLGIAWINAQGKCFEWLPRHSHLPMITAGQTPVFLGRDETLSLISSADFKPSEMVCLSPKARALLSSSSYGKARVLSMDVHPSRIHFEVETDPDQHAMAVIAQSFYPGWKAYVDLKPTALWHANYAFQALQIPPGRHQVTIQFEDAALKWGALVSGLCGAVLTIMWLCLRPKAGPTPAP